MAPHIVAMGAATLLGRAAAWFGTSKTGQTISSVLYNPFVQSGQFGIGYTGGAYLGYGASNTLDPLGLHNKSYKRTKSQPLGIMPYGRRYYGRRSYYSRYGRRYRRRRSYRSRYYRRYY